MKLKFNIPTQWNELNQKQFEKIALLFSTTEPSLIRDIKLLKILFQTKWWQIIRKAQIRYFISQVPYCIVDKENNTKFIGWKNYINFLLTENNRTHFEPIIKVGNKTYFAPMDRIINLTADEFAVADDLHIGYRKTLNQEYLLYLFHVLYSETEQRPLFDKNNLEKLKNPKIPNETLLATEFVYAGCKNYIAKKFKKAFPEGSTNTSGKSYGFGKVIQGMSKGDLSKLQTVERINIYKFLEQFQDDIEVIKNQKIKK